MKTVMPDPAQVGKKWYVVDADGKILGRLASEIARILRGKHRPEYSLSADFGDYVIVINAEKIKVSGKKEEKIKFHTHSGWVGHLKEISYRTMMEKHPERILAYAVKGMMPKNALGRKMFKKLKIHTGPTHPHEAQMPEVLEIKV